jgi:hypothetical protein
LLEAEGRKEPRIEYNGWHRNLLPSMWYSKLLILSGHMLWKPDKGEIRLLLYLETGDHTFCPQDFHPDGKQ